MKSLYLDLTSGVAEVSQTLEEGFDLQNATFETIDLALCQSIIKLSEMRNTLKELGAVK
jgi:hypothetical protein